MSVPTLRGKLECAFEVTPRAFQLALTLPGNTFAVSRPFPSWHRSRLTEIYPGHACLCQERLRADTAGQEVCFPTALLQARRVTSNGEHVATRTPTERPGQLCIADDLGGGVYTIVAE
jgi:hypothetical protein